MAPLGLTVRRHPLKGKGEGGTRGMRRDVTPFAVVPKPRKAEYRGGFDIAWGVRSMPTLDWIGKAAVANHHRQVPTRLLHRDRALSRGAEQVENLLVQGDNL